MATRDAAGRAMRYAGGSARGRLLHHGVGHDPSPKKYVLLVFLS